MKIFAVCSRSFERLRDEWFLATLPADMEPIILECPVDSVPGFEFRSPAHLEALDFKLYAICDVIREHPGEVVCFSDLDVQFFGSFRNLILDAMENHDVAGMREWKDGGLNGGFYAIRCAPHVEALWEEAAAADKSDAYLHDQDALNALLESDAHHVTHTLLPDTFWASHRHLMFEEPEPPSVLVNHATGWMDKEAELRRMRDKFRPDLLP
jgi:hypothetical protein